MMTSAAVLEGTCAGMVIGQLHAWRSRSLLANLASLALVLSTLYQVRGAALVLQEDLPYAREWAAAWDVRESGIRVASAAGVEHVVIPQLPGFENVRELAPRASVWINRCAARLYGVKSISAADGLPALESGRGAATGTEGSSTNMLKDKPILVTGAHRTGTTWVGKMLAANGRVAYISEPLNVLHRPGVMRSSVPLWYTYITEENEAQYLPALRETLAYRYHLPAEIASLRSGHDFLRMCRDTGIFLRGWLLRQRPLLKDPFAVFSIPWFARRLDCEIVVTVRHPAGFASSLKRLNWPFDFADLLAQPPLMRDHLEPYRGRMEAMPSEDIIGQASLLWAMVYRSVRSICRSLPNVHIVKHEDLSVDPLPGFGELYDRLGLAFTEDVQRAIRASSSSENPAELSTDRVHSVRLDSRANLHNWKRRLAPEEIRRIRLLTEEVAHDYYPEVDWN